jgi:ABC-type dipeptide/oligopeptide/nickel transport system permease component
MLRFLGRRLLASLLTLLGVIVVTFTLARVIPSDPAVVYIGPLARPAEIARVTKELGLDRPLPEQFLTYVRDLARGDWGTSLGTKEPVLHAIGDRAMATLELVLVAMALAVAIGIPLGVIAARRNGGAVDASVRVASVAGISMPVFWLGLLLQVSLAGEAGIFPAIGRQSIEASVLHPTASITGFLLVDSLVSGNLSGFADASRHIVLPALTLAAYPAAVVMRMTRASMLDVLGQDYVRTANAFGLKQRLIVWRLALRNALPATTTVIGLSFAYMLTNTFFVELVYNWPGIGLFATTALLNVDYPVIMGITLISAVVFLTINLVVDLVQARLDPRIRLQ